VLVMEYPLATPVYRLVELEYFCLAFLVKKNTVTAQSKGTRQSHLPYLSNSFM